MRLTLDTTVLVAAFRSHTGASRRLLELVPSRAFRIVASPALYLEYEAVLTRPEHLNLHGLSPRKIEEALVYLAGFTDKVRIHFSYRPQLRNANDEMVPSDGQSLLDILNSTHDHPPLPSDGL